MKEIGSKSALTVDLNQQVVREACRSFVGERVNIEFDDSVSILIQRETDLQRETR